MTKLNHVNVPLAIGDAQILMDILLFANRAANLLAHQEMTKGGGVTAATTMSIMAKNAKELAHIVSSHIDIGEPPNGSIN